VLHDSDVTLAKIKSQLAEGGVSGPLLAVWGEWLDRLSKLSKLILDSGIRERLHKISKAQADQLISVIDHVLADPRIIVAPGIDPRIIVSDAIKSVASVAQMVATG
jgi:hypothetical protein